MISGLVINSRASDSNMSESSKGERDGLLNEIHSSTVYGSREIVDKRTTHTSDTYTVKVPKCSVIIEPYVAIAFFCLIGNNPMVEQYIYAVFAQSYPALQNSTTNHSLSETCKNSNQSDNDGDVYNATQLVQTETSRWMMYFNILQCVPSLFMTVLIGGYSDKRYRKPAILLPAIGQVIRLSMNFVVIHYKLSIYYIAAGSVVYGLFGGTSTITMSVFAYIADTINPESRSLRIVVVNVIMSLSGAVAESMLGVLIKTTGFWIPSAIIVILALVAMLYVIFIVPETHRPFPGTTFSIKECISATWITYTKREGHRRPKLALLLPMLAFPQFSLIGSQAVSVLYQMHYPLCWGADMIGAYLAYALLVIQFGSLFGAGVFRRCMSDAVICMIGNVSGMATFLFYSMSTTTLMVFAGEYSGFVALKN